MKKLLLGLGAMTVMAVPAVVAVSCNEDTTPATEYGKIADKMRSITPEKASDNGALIWKLPADFGMSSPEVLNKIESEVRTHFGFGTGSDDKEFGFTVGTYHSTGNEDDHIELQLMVQVGGSNTAILDAKVSSLIDFISTIE